MTADADTHGRLRSRLARQPIVDVPTPSGTLTLHSRHGLFSARTLDAGTAMLLAELWTLPQVERVLDIGCGYGALGLALASQWPETEVVLVDSDIRAVEACKQNIDQLRLQRAKVTLSDGTRNLPMAEQNFALVVSNLPAQAGNDALDQLLLDAYDALAEGGLFAIVAVNGLRTYLQRRLADIFQPRQVSKVRQGPRHTVLQAAKLSS